MNNPIPTTKRVSVETGVKTVEAVSQNGEPIVIGEVIERGYQGEDLAKLFFRSIEVDKDGTPKEYSLGPVTPNWKITDHADIVLPFVQEGWEISRVDTLRGGADQIAVLTHPALSHEDPITWDGDFWGRDAKDGGLRDSISISSSIRPGKGITFQRGFFRLICTNGLTSTLFNLAKFTYTHTNLSVNKALERLFAVGGDQGNSSLTGPVLGSIRGVQGAAEWISNPNFEGKDYFFQKDTQAIAATPDWYRQSLADQLFAFTRNAPSNWFHSLDLANALTNPISLAQREREGEVGSYRLYDRMDVLSESTARLISRLS